MISNSFILSTITTSFLFAFFAWLIIHLALRKQKLARWQLLSAALGIILLIWFFTIFGLGKSGFFFDDPLIIPNIVFGFLVLFELLRRVFSAMIKKIVADIPMITWLIGLQTYRIVGFGFLSLQSQGLLPAIFAIPSGYGDILVGVTAPLAAFLYYFKKPYARQIAIAWNILGIVDLVMAVSLGFLAFSRPVQFIVTTVSTEQMALFPLVLITLFAVPLALVLHLFCLRALKVANPSN